MQEINEKIEKGSENLKTKPETPNTDGEYGVDNNDTLESEKITEYDYSDESSIEKLHDVIDCLSSEEALSALEAIRRTHGVGDTLELMGFKEWFDKAFFPVLQNFAVESFAKLYVERDADENITVTIVNKQGFIIGEKQKQMRMVLMAADDISISQWGGVPQVEMVLSFNAPQKSYIV